MFCWTKMAFLSFVALALFVIRVHTLSIPDYKQIALQLDPRKSTDEVVEAAQGCSSSIAIIGSGISGAIAAFRLAEGYRQKELPGQQPCITVFEQNPVVGGRITEAFVYDDPRRPVGTCAATFSAFDTCVASAVADVGLTVFPEEFLRPKAGTGVWDGQNILGFVDQDDFRAPGSWSYFKRKVRYPRYQDIPLEFDFNVTDARLKFDELLATPFPFVPDPAASPPIRGKGNLRVELESAKLEELVQNPLCFSDKRLEFTESAEGYNFFLEAIVPGVRERFFADKEDLNMLELYFGFEDAIPSSIPEGNLRLIERLLKVSDATVRLNTKVLEVEKPDKQFGKLDFELTIAPPSGGTTKTERFDSVVVATSLTRGNIEFYPALPDSPGLYQEYRDSVVTHFTTRSRLDPSFFNWIDEMPENILTVGDKGADFGSYSPFFSLTFLREELSLDKGFATPVERLYKMVSREFIPDSQIEEYLVPLQDDSGSPLITWIHRETLPQSVPIVNADRGEPCRSLLEDFEIAPRIYYAGGGEQVVASAEFGCRFGENVANIILNGYDY